MAEVNNFSKFIGKRCKVFLKNRQCYTGAINNVDSVSISMTDKYQLDVVISLSDISLIRDLEEDER